MHFIPTRFFRLSVFFKTAIGLFLCINIANAQSENLSDVRLPENVIFTRLDSTEVLSRQVWQKPGKPTVIAFWLTTCGPCHVELAAYAQKYAEWKTKADFQLLAVSIDFPQRFRQMVNMSRNNAYPFEVYWDGKRTFKDLLPGGLNGLPQVFLFDSAGQLVWQHKKFLPGDENVLFAEILKYQAKN